MKTLYQIKQPIIGCLLLAFLSACSSSLFSTPNPTPTPVSLPTEVTKSIVYANVDDIPTKLDVYAPSEPGSWPVVVVVHGYSKNRFSLEDLASAISSRGAVVINPDVAFEVPFSTGIERLACAIRFARAIAADYNGDPARITLFGYSAGGASGMTVSLAGDDFNEDCVMSDGSALPDALVAYEGPYEFVMKSYGGVVVHPLLSQGNPDKFEAINPYSHIGRNPDLQVRLIHGDDDDELWYEIRLEESVEMHQTLENAGYDTELIVVDGASHIGITSRYTEEFALVVQEVMELAGMVSE